jgi:predicted CXXCH cytochrome family protein
MDRGQQRLGGAVGGVLVAVLVVACSSEARYHVLSFFFDGVPSPPGVGEHEIGAQAAFPRPYTSFGPGQPVVAGLEKPAAARLLIQSVHEPVRENRCQACHKPPFRYDEMPPPDARLCDECHLEKRQEEGWDHGPINLGTCIPCHVPHRSQYPHLLDKPIPDLCLLCHKEDLERPEDYHDVPNINDCIACHDPHRMY